MVWGYWRACCCRESPRPPGAADYLVLVADTRKLTGWEAWWANLYNESHLYFTLVTVVIIPVVGLCFGLIADIVMSRIGLDLKSRELAEH